MKAQERIRTRKYLRSAKGIKVGDRFIYISNGIEMYENGKKIVISKGVEYEAEVIQVTEHLIAMRLKADQSTMNTPYLWDSQPYNWSIRKVDIGITEKLYLV